MKKDNKPYWIVNKTNAQTAEIYLYGYIGYQDGVKTSEFVRELKELCQSYNLIKLRINSGGGNVYEGIAIINVIRQYRDKIEAYIDGVAASMAAIIALIVDKCYMNRYARFMTHRVQGGNFGNADELRALADQCDGLDNDLAEILSEKTGLSKEETKAKYITASDRWLTAEQALKEKLITGTFDGEKVTVPENVSDEEEIWNIYNRVLNVSRTPGRGTPDNEPLVMVLSIEDVLPINSQSNNTLTPQESKEVVALVAKGYNELFMSGELERLKNLSETAYREVYKNKFGKYPAKAHVTASVSSKYDAMAKESEIAALVAKGYNALFMSDGLARLKSLSLEAYNAICKQKFG